MTVTGPELPEPLRRFLLTTIDSLDQLDLLVVLVRTGRSWSVGELSTELVMRRTPVEQALEDLTKRGLLEVKIGTTVLYRYAPASADLRVADSLPEYYAAARTEFAQQSTTRRRALRTFAGAFDFRHKDRNRDS